MYEYLYMENGGESGVYQGLLMRDQKYLRKNMQKICQLSVKESANKLIKRHTDMLKSSYLEKDHQPIMLNNQ